MPTVRTVPAAVCGVLLLVAVLPGCSVAPTPAPAAGTTVVPQQPALPGPAPAVAADVAPDEVWGLAQLVPPADLVVGSAVRRPDADDLASYLLVGTTSPEGARTLCDQLGGLVGTTALDGDQRASWGLDADPAGTLGTCSGPDPVVPSVQREVLVVEADGTATVRLSTYDTPLP